MERGLLVVAGEVSGDIHAGNMLRELHRIDPDVHAFGVGGEQLVAAGLEPLATTDELAHMGLVEVLRELPRIRRIMHRLVDEARNRRPKLAVLVDSPDFNLRLAARLRRLGIPVVLYVSPQLWAWRRGRVRTVRRLAREVLCILPFEVGFYEAHGVRARYVGHPLVDDIARVGLLDRHMVRTPGRLGMLPGSRAMEVSQLLPVMVQTLRNMPQEQVCEALLVEAPGMAREVDTVLARVGSDPRLRSGPLATRSSRRRTRRLCFRPRGPCRWRSVRRPNGRNGNTFHQLLHIFTAITTNHGQEISHSGRATEGDGIDLFSGQKARNIRPTLPQNCPVSHNGRHFCTMIT